MKRFFMFFVAIFMMASMNAQSIQWHQSYDGNQKFVSDFFWNNDNYNVYSYNEFTVSNNQSVGYGIIYGEYRVNKSHFLVHAETRFRTASFPTSMIPTAMYYPDNNLANIGFAYELCLDKWVFNLTPMYRWDFGKGSNWQFSINSSADFERNGFTIFDNTNTAEVHPSMRSITSGETIEETTFTEVGEEKVPIKIKGKYF